MTEKELKINYWEYSGPEELEAEDRILVEEALAAKSNAYAPYSNFKVGAAVRMSGGHIVRGCNQENAAYPSGMCAERTAMFAANAAYPEEDMCSIALAGGPGETVSDSPATPCGACRQVMAQYQTKAGKPMNVILVGASRIWKFERVDDILPLIFDSI